jgi:hypothetical protein
VIASEKGDPKNFEITDLSNIGRTVHKSVILLVGAEGLEPWTQLIKSGRVIELHWQLLCGSK